VVPALLLCGLYCPQVEQVTQALVEKQAQKCALERRVAELEQASNCSCRSATGV
jgi:hypothetical protein